MWTSLAVVAALGLAPSQGGELTLSKGSFTYWLLGTPRPNNEFLPGDVVYIAFDMENAKADAVGQVQYSMGIKVSDARGKKIFESETGNLTALNILGGNTVQCFARVDVGLDQPPGDCVIEVTVTDRTAKVSQKLQQKFKVLPAGFGVVRVGMSHDERGVMPSPALGVPGETIWLRFWACGFQRDKAKKQPQLGLEIRIVDEDGKATLPKPINEEINMDVPEAERMYPITIPLNLNRPGKFTAQLKVTDKLTKKSEEVSVPLTVVTTSK